MSFISVLYLALSSLKEYILIDFCSLNFRYLNECVLVDFCRHVIWLYSVLLKLDIKECFFEFDILIDECVFLWSAGLIH